MADLYWFIYSLNMSFHLLVNTGFNLFSKHE